MKFTAQQATHQGARRYNQDRAAYAYTDHALLLVLADGMGGHLHGEVAAQIAIDIFVEAFAQAAQPRVSDPVLFLREIMRCGHEAIMQYAREEKLAGSPGTTCVAALIQDGRICWAHAGDSRLYWLRGESVMSMSRDHSMVQQWADWGIISKADMRTHPDRNRITNCLGGVEDMFFVESSVLGELHADDVLLLCSDGLWGPLEDAELTHAFEKFPLSEALRNLMRESLQRDGSNADNTTAVVARWGGNEPEQPAPITVCQPLICP
jgi:PPM family protein phosphatase